MVLVLNIEYSKCPKIPNEFDQTFAFTQMLFEILSYGKQCRPWSDCSHLGLLAYAILSEILENIWNWQELV